VAPDATMKLCQTGENAPVCGVTLEMKKDCLVCLSRSFKPNPSPKTGYHVKCGCLLLTSSWLVGWLVGWLGFYGILAHNLLAVSCLKYFEVY